MERKELIDSLVLYYQGEDKLKNPIKMIVEKGLYTQELVDEIKSKLRSELSQSFLDFDLWLNKLPTYESIDDYSVVELYRGFIGDNRNALMLDKYIDNFYEADLLPRDFLDLMFDSYRFHPDNNTQKQSDVDTDTAMLLHKDFPKSLKAKIFDMTQDERFLSQEAKDIFLF